MFCLTNCPVLLATDFYRRPSKTKKIVDQFLSATLITNTRDASASKNHWKTIATNGLPDQKPLIPMVAFQPFIGTSEYENLEKFQLQSQ